MIVQEIMGRANAILDNCQNCGCDECISIRDEFIALIAGRPNVNETYDARLEESWRICLQAMQEASDPLDASARAIAALLRQLDRARDGEKHL